MEALAELKKLTIPSLKGLLQQKGLKVSGKKGELIARLMRGPPEEDGPTRKKHKGDSEDEAKTEATLEDFAAWCQLTNSELKEKVREKGLKLTGTRPELLARLWSGKTHPKDEEIDIAEGMGKNAFLLEKFTREMQSEEGFQKIALNRIVQLMRFYPVEITSGKQAKKLKGLGDSSAKKVDAWLLEREKGSAEEKDVEGSDSEATTSAHEPSQSALELQADIKQVLKKFEEKDDEGVGMALIDIIERVEEQWNEEEVSTAVRSMALDGEIIAPVDELHFILAS